jgi:hypothetical protein
MMKISWFATGMEDASDAGPRSSRASTRLRCLIPAQGIGALGHQVKIIRSDTISDPSQLADDDFGDAVVFSKSFVPIDEEFAGRARRLGRLVVYDFCDFDFLNPEIMGHREKMTGLAHRCVAASQALASAVADTFGARTPAVIPDPFEGSEGTPKFSPQMDALRLA